MTTPEMTAEKIAAELFLLTGPQRTAFLERRCAGDARLREQVELLVVKLESTDRDNAERLATIDPLATISSLERLVEGGIPNEIAESDDAAQKFFSQGSLRQQAAPSLPEHHENAAFEATLDAFTTKNASSLNAPLENAKFGTARNAEVFDEANLTLSPDVMSHTEGVCRRFLDAWSQGTEPKLQEYLESSGDSEVRNYLAFRLVVLDLEQRRVRNRPLSELAYLSQVPDCQNAIRSALTQQKTNPSKSGPQKRTTVDSGRLNAPNANGDHLPSHLQNGEIRYHPFQMHAKGGLGAVYRAKDMELSRTVALKRILPAHEDNSNSRARFVFEAEVTGSLEHPGIVPVYGLGTYGDGQPYYAMRFIRGESFSSAIKRFHEVAKASTSVSKGQTTDAKAGQSAVASRTDSNTGGDAKEIKRSFARDFYGREFRMLLRRLIDTCNAMHYAHERGVLHRDLKPDNVMLGQYGETLVVDWGLAKLMSPSAIQPQDVEATSEPLTVTDSGLRTTIGMAVGTPMYMSPEQAFGLHDHLEPTSDIYSLGGMLFTMVSGEYPIAGKTAPEIILSVRSGTVRNLSETMTSAPKPLVSICRKSMSKEPIDRYQTAKELAEDIDRWLSDEPVLAHADHESVGEKLGRLIRRYRGWTVSGAVALLAVTIVSIIASLLINQAKEAEKVAKVRATRFKGEAVQRYHESREAIDTWLVQSNDALQFFPGTQAVRQRLLTVAVEDYAKLTSTASEDPELELERGRTLIRLGDLNQMQEDMPGAMKHYREAIALLDSERSLAPTSTDARSNTRWLYGAEAANAKARLAIAMVNSNQLVEAESLYNEATALLATVHQHFDDPLLLRYRGSTMVNHGELCVMQNRFDEAEQKFVDGLDLFTRLGDQMTSSDVLSISRTDELLGRMLGKLGKHESALKHFASTVSRLERLVEANSDHPEYLDALASVFISQASTHRATGRFQSERESLGNAVEHYRDLVAALPDLPRYRENLAATLTDLGLLLYEMDRCAEAEPMLIEASDLISTLARRYDSPPYYQSQLATNQDALGQVLWNLSEREPAQILLVQSLQAYVELNEKHPEIADYAERLAIVKSHLSRTVDGADSDEGFRSAAESLVSLVTEFPKVPNYASALGYVYLQHGWKLHNQNPTSAVELFAKARDTWVAMGALRDAKTCERLAWLLTTCPANEIRDLVAAKLYANEALASSPENQHYRSTLALAMALNGEITEAESLMTSKPVNEQDRDARECLTLAVIASKAKNSERAKQFREPGIRWANEHAPGSDDLLVLMELSGQ